MKNKGFILLTALIFLFLLTLLSVHALNESQLQWRMGHNFIERLRETQAMELALQTGEKQLANNPLTNHIFTIYYNRIKIHYIIETIKGTSCVQSQEGIYYRVTVWTGDPDHPTRRLQTTYAQSLDKPCQSTEKNIQSGRLSWREF